MHKPLTYKAKEVHNFTGIFKSRMKRIDSSYKLIEFLSGRRSSADAVINEANVEFRFRVVVLIEKLVFDLAYEKIGIACPILVPMATPLICL